MLGIRGGGGDLRSGQPLRRVDATEPTWPSNPPAALWAAPHTGPDAPPAPPDANVLGRSPGISRPVSAEIPLVRVWRVTDLCRRRWSISTGLIVDPGFLGVAGSRAGEGHVSVAPPLRRKTPRSSGVGETNVAAAGFSAAGQPSRRWEAARTVLLGDQLVLVPARVHGGAESASPR